MSDEPICALTRVTERLPNHFRKLVVPCHLDERLPDDRDSGDKHACRRFVREGHASPFICNNYAVREIRERCFEANTNPLQFGYSATQLAGHRVEGPAQIT